jgi:phosphonatase-like hydrolase
MAIRLVVFDLAGTTVVDRDAVALCIQEALNRAGLALDLPPIIPVMGLPKPEALRLLIVQDGRPDLIPSLNAIHSDFVARMSRFYREDPSIRAVEGVPELFERLHAAGIKVAVNTGFSRDIVDVLLDRLGWVRDGLIDASATSDEVPRGRPHPDMIVRIMEQVGVEYPAEVAKVGDTPADLGEGTDAGCGLVIGVTWGTHTREQLAAYPHTHLVDAVEELGPLLGLV